MTYFYVQNYNNLFEMQKISNVFSDNLFKCGSDIMGNAHAFSRLLLPLPGLSPRCHLARYPERSRSTENNICQTIFTKSEVTQSFFPAAEKQCSAHRNYPLATLKLSSIWARAIVSVPERYPPYSPEHV